MVCGGCLWSLSVTLTGRLILSSRLELPQQLNLEKSTGYIPGPLCIVFLLFDKNPLDTMTVYS